MRVLTRDARAGHLPPTVEIVEGDVRERADVEHTVAGVETVVSAVQGSAGPGHVTPESVDTRATSR